MMWQYSKAGAAYALTAALSWAASRYHLNADQVMAISTDVTAVVVAAYGIYSHGQAAKMTPPNGGTA